MLELEKPLAAQLKRFRVHVDAPDGDTVFLRNVPVNKRFFDKGRTNLLIKRPREGLPFVICVDEDLNYTGSDKTFIRAFSGGHRQRGWRVLLAGHDAQSSLQAVVERSLEILGFEGRDPVLSPRATEDIQAVPPGPSSESAGPTQILAGFGTSLSRQMNGSQLLTTVRREEEIDAVISCLIRWQVRMPVIVGESGVGKTELLHAAARGLARRRPELNVIAIDLAALMAGTLFDSERENLLSALLKEAAETDAVVVAMEHLELALMGLPRGALLLGQAVDQGVRLIGTTLPGFAPLFEGGPLARRLQIIRLAELGIDATTEVVDAVRTRIADHHGVRIDESLNQVVVDSAQPLAGHFPAKAIALLDAAAASAALSAESEVSQYDISLVADGFGRNYK